MTPKQFDERYIEELHRFLKLCEQERVFFLVERIRPRIAPQFASELIHDLTEGEALKRIQSNIEGAAALAVLSQELARERSNRPSLAAQMPQGELTPFFVLSSMVLFAAHDDRTFLETATDETPDSDAPPTDDSDALS